MIDISQLEKLVEDLRGLLPGIIATDIWIRETSKSLAGYNAQPAAVDLFNTLTRDLENLLAGAKFPELHRYIILDLQGNHSVVIIRHGSDILQGLLIDSRSTNMGQVLALGLPMALDRVKNAR